MRIFRVQEGIDTIYKALFVKQQPHHVQKRIKAWAKKRKYKILSYRKGYIKLKVGRGYSRAMVVVWILTFWTGAIIHRAIRADHDKLLIYIFTYGQGTVLHLQGKGPHISKAIGELRSGVGGKTFHPSPRV